MELQPWELLLKKLVWKQLDFINGKRVLDFGSGHGVTANHFAKNNQVVAVEPSEEMLLTTDMENDYIQIKGGVDELRRLESESFDVILCHNVLEYVDDKAEVLREFDRILKGNGIISVVKHNRAGRVMQMVVLLNDFAEAKHLLNGGNSMAKQFGEIKYYEDEYLTEQLSGYEVVKNYGIRTFWDLQQNQEIHKDSEWQDKMIEMEAMVSEMDEYRAIAFFHHLILKKL
ncbi:MAG: class I SAM-dependent methyltransferase [Lachnospiraceae bacterium]|nr:class I SAM-dependent methyltransferase [Lachnospiraceae bacterium]